MGMSQVDVRVAIVGAGPRGLWAAEELLGQAWDHGVHVAVDVWDDRRPGAGAAYGPEQPDHWTLNVSSRIVSSGLGTFDDWRRGIADAEQGPFPPRSLVGRFFAESWECLLATARRRADSGCTVRVIPERVTVLRRADGEHSTGWTVNGRGYDHVLLATGHAPSWPGALPATVAGASGPVPVVGVYPSDGLRTVAPGAVVDVRGAALTFVDAVLELTAGRHGTFLPAEVGVTYRPSGAEPSAIRPVSRSGRFMTVKPDPASPLADLRPAEVLGVADRRVRTSRTTGELQEALACAADRLLTTAGGRPAPEQVRTIISGTDWSAVSDPVAELRQSWAVATGRAAPDAAWAVGHAWRILYPAVVWRTSYGRRRPLAGFDALARTLERVAFGMTPPNAARLLALLDAGIVHPPVRAAVGTLDPPADVVVDAVIPPAGLGPGTLAANIPELSPGARAGDAGDTGDTGDTAATGWVDEDGHVRGVEQLAVIGRDAEGVLIGADSLDRSGGTGDAVGSGDAVIPRWARRVVAHHRRRHLDKPGAEGTVPLTARLEPWAVSLLSDGGRCRSLVEDHGSPVNVLRTVPMVRNMAELRDAGANAGVDTRVFYARKANKALCFVDTAVQAGHGVDVASERELQQVLDRGVPGDRVILSAAVKPDRLLRLAVDHGVTVSVDTVAELTRLRKLGEPGSGTGGRRPRVAPRIAPDPSRLPPTRFGERVHVWADTLSSTVDTVDTVDVVGVHLHLHGYSAADRLTALEDALGLIDTVVELGHRPTFVDLGGGVPMSYLDDEAEWEDFRCARQAMVDGTGEPFTWKSDPLTSTYPFHQAPVRADWLRELLRGQVNRRRQQETAASALVRRGLRLHLEPGRSVLDGCGVILARVAFLKDRSDGVPLVGVEMNRTQCRTTSDDILVDPLLVRVHGGHGTTPERAPGAEGFLVGAYCIEDEVIIRRRLRFPEGISTGDVIAIPNTAGYFMHILESASHQIPLAVNVVLEADGTARVDGIDGIDEPQATDFRYR